MSFTLLVADKERLQHILERIALIEQLLAETERDVIRHAALERCFEVIGEACRHVSKQVRDAYPSIPWTSIIGLRNIVTHEYDLVEIKTLWDIAEHKIPALKDWITGILEKHQ